MGYPCAGEESNRAQRERWVFTFSIEKDLRFISHRDTLRLFERALARASLPVRYSEGFNPHPRLSIPLPRPVGIASRAEAIVIEFERPVDGDEALDKLRQQMPPDLTMIAARRLDNGERLQPTLVRYRLDPPDPHGKDLESRVRHLQSCGEAMVSRVNYKSGQTRSINVRPYLVDINLDGHTVEFTLRVTPDGGVKPAEIVRLLGMKPEALDHRIRRLEVRWKESHLGKARLS
jgi:radical SAM-linked protein